MALLNYDLILLDLLVNAPFKPLAGAKLGDEVWLGVEIGAGTGTGGRAGARAGANG